MSEFTTGNLDPDQFDHLVDPTDRNSAPTNMGDRAIERALNDEDDVTDLDDIRSELAEQATLTHDLGVEGRPNYTVRFRIDFSGKEIDKLRQASKDRSFADKVDGVKFGALLLAKTCVQVRRNGKPLIIDGKVATFMEPAFLDMFAKDEDRGKPVSAVVGIQRFYALDGYLDATARALMERAGWGDEARQADPTE